jgi:hypothetical protein
MQYISQANIAIELQSRQHLFLRANSRILAVGVLHVGALMTLHSQAIVSAHFSGLLLARVLARTPSLTYIKGPNYL